MIQWLRPHDQIDEQQVHTGLRMLVCDGACSQAMGAFTGGAVLVAFAVLLGASNLVIGLLAAVGPLTQILQIPTVLLVDRTGLPPEQMPARLVSMAEGPEAGLPVRATVALQPA